MKSSPLVIFSTLSVGVVLFLAPALFAADEKLTPAEELKTFSLPDGLQASLVTSEPDVSQPLSIEFDTKGRMWVLQYLQYPIPNGLKAVEVDQYLRTKYDKLPEPPPQGPTGKDRISIYEDNEGDGKMELVSHFLSDLNLASGFAVDHDGVYVVQPPYLLFYPDKDHDDKPDGDPKVLLTGFGMEDAHAFANSLTWGPDGWLYGVQGSTVTAEIRGIGFQQGIWRYHPPTDRFELFSEGGGNSWGLDFDQFGNAFAGGNTSEPLVHQVQGAYYVKGFGKHGPLHNPHAYGYFQPVKHHGYLGDSLTGGFVLYQGGAFPEKYKHQCIAPNTRHSAMRWSTLEPHGSTWETHAAGDFMMSSHNWFRPVESVVGPDGALYVADWYDYNISHSSPQNRGKWYNPSRFDGRIWRVAPAEIEPVKVEAINLEEQTREELVTLLSHSNVWYVRHARRLLAHQMDDQIEKQMIQMALNQEDQMAALQGLWVLNLSGRLSEKLAGQLLKSPHEYVRAWVVRLHGDEEKFSPALFAECVKLAKSDHSAIVRSQLACTTKRLSGSQAFPILHELWLHEEDLDDPFIPLLIWWALEEKAISDIPLVMQGINSKGFWEQPLVQQTLLNRLARRYTAEGTEDAYRVVAQLLEQATDQDTRQPLLIGMALALAGQKMETVPAPLEHVFNDMLEKEKTNPQLLQLALRFGVTEAEPLVLNLVQQSPLSNSERIDLIQCLGQTGSSAVAHGLLNLLNQEKELAVQKVILEALGRFQEPEISHELLSSFSHLNSGLHDQMVGLLCSREAWANELITAVESNHLKPELVTLEHLRQLLLLSNPELQKRIIQKWGTIKPATAREKAGRVKAIIGILRKGEAEAAQGKVLFKKLCANCHKLHGEGNNVGPDLTGAERKDREKLLTNIVDPSGMVRAQYIMNTVVTEDGRVLNGLLAGSTPETLTLVDKQNNKIVLNRNEIEEMKESDISLMPGKILEPLSDQELRDLFQYLQSK